MKCYYFFSYFPIPRGLTPLAEAVLTQWYGIERRAQGNVLSSAAVFVRRCDFGQWRQAAWNEKKNVKTPANPGFAEYRSPWATSDAAPRLDAGTVT